MKDRVQDLRNTLEQDKGRRAQIQKSVADLQLSLKQGRRTLRRHELARELIKEVGLKTQQQLRFHIEDITTLALETVFDDPYELIVEFVQRRNKTECDLFFMRNDSKVDPLEASGGGAVDIAAFALRIASWSMEHPKSRSTIILDEPFHFLSQDHQERASEMLKEISNKLGIQFIVVTHETALTPFADRIFETKIRKRVTKIKSN